MAGITNTCRMNLLISIFSMGFIQLDGQCYDGDIQTSSCETAPLICLFDLCARTTSNFGGPPYIGFCGPNTAVHNPQYFKFIASEEEIRFSIHIDFCEFNSPALQGAILDTCDWTISDVVACHPGVLPGELMSLTAQNMNIGKTYWLLIDGSSGSLCQFHIVHVEGIELPHFTQELDPDQLEAVPNVICPGYDSFQVFAGPAVDFEVGYEWTISSNGEFYTVLHTPDPQMSFDFDEFTPPGQWEVCVRAVSGCDSTENVCTPFEVISDDFEIVELGNQICGPGDQLSYQWRECGSDILLSTNQCYTPDGATCYCLSISSPVGCIATSCVDLTVSTSDENYLTGISVYPNPVSGKLNIDLTENVQLPVTWSLYNSIGVRQAVGSINSLLSDLKFSKEIQPGFYVIEFRNVSGLFCLQKIIID